MFNFFKKSKTNEIKDTDGYFGSNHSESIGENILQDNSIISNAIHEDFFAIKEGEVRLHGTSISPANDGLVAGFFIDNGLTDTVKFDTLPLILIDSEKRVIARQVFQGDIVGEVAAGMSKACVVRFTKDHVYSQEIPPDCAINFDLKAGIPLGSESPSDLKFQLQGADDINPGEREELERVLDILPPMNEGEMNFSILKYQIKPPRDLFISVIIRSTIPEMHTLGLITLAVFDANGKELVRRAFALNGVTVAPYHALHLLLDFGSFCTDLDIDITKLSLLLLDDSTT